LRRHFCQNAGIDLVGLDLRLGNDARLEGIGQHNVLPRHGLFQNLEQPVSVHAGLKDYPTPGPSSHQRNKLLRAEVIDASSFQNHSLCVEHTEDTVAFVIVDADEARLLFQNRLCFSSHNLHPSILCGSADHSARRSSFYQPLSPDPYPIQRLAIEQDAVAA
jgi:hypothetical protein